MATTRSQYAAEVAKRQREKEQQDEGSALVQHAQDQWREGKSTRRTVEASRLNPYGDAAKAAEHERIAASIRTRRAEAEQAAAAAAAAAAGEEPNPGTMAAERGQRDFVGGMKLITEAGRKVAVTGANPTYGAVKTYTDTMGHGAQREGRFVGAREQPAPQAPVQVVVQTPGAQAPAPAQPQQPSPVPAGAAPGTVPGEVPSNVVPVQPIPLEEGQPSQAQAAPSARQVPAAAVAHGPPGSELEKGVLQQQLNAAEDLAQAKVDQAQGQADAMTEAAEQYDAALEQQRAAEADEAARIEAQLEARKTADTEIAAATKAFGEAQTLSPEKAWTNMAAGRKVAFIVGAIGSGLRALATGNGSSDPLARIKEAVSAEVDAQQAAITKLGSNLDAARARGSSAEAVYANVLAQVGDARQARSITEVARLNQIKADFEARLARDGVKVLSAEQQAFLTGLAEEIAGKQQAIDVQTAKNPRTITRSVYAHGKGQRDALLTGGKAMVASGVKGIESGEEYGQKAALQGMELDSKAALEREKRTADKAEKTETRIYSEMATFADKTAAGQQAVGLIDKLLLGPDGKGNDDIAGYGWTAGPTVGNAANNVEADLEAIAESFGRLQSQGVISPDEETRFREMLKDGTTLGGEKRLRQNLQRVKGMVNLKIEAYERGLSPEARAYYRRNKNNPDFKSQWSGGTGEQVVQVDE